MKKILVANRGEIALRVMRTARSMGIQTVAVYSEADRDAPHVLYADEAVLLGPPPSAQSYLRGQLIIEKALALQVDAIHPGYGFLSENAVFARQVTEAGMIFIGPSPYSIEIMGSKLAAKDAVKKYGIPMVPGTDSAIHHLEEARLIAAQTGYPVLIKASAGGGGKGMRVVLREEELEEQMQRAISEAMAAFGDGSVFIEKFVTSPRHIEIQVLADLHGNTVYLFERECSIQRRHQKVVEEAPSCILTPALRKRMGEDAVKVAQACQYAGAGTVEFLMDDQMNYYFLEMNTRLQVEHPVTEMITGLDLVEQQIRVARGESLAFRQEDLSIQGHAIELRVCAEDPLNDFLPSTGLLTQYRPPHGPGIRLDSGYREGMEVAVYYDPLLAKLVAHGISREEAMARLLQAIADFRLEGVETTLDFGRFVLQHAAFREGRFDTNFISHYFRPENLSSQYRDESSIAARLSIRLALDQKKQLKTVTIPPDRWKSRKIY